MYASGIDNSTEATADLSGLNVSGRTLHAFAYLYEPEGSALTGPQAHVCISRTKLVTMSPRPPLLKAVRCALTVCDASAATNLTEQAPDQTWPKQEPKQEPKQPK